jgi:hypothetical protein
VVIDLEQHHLLTQAVLALAQRGDPTSNRRHMLADAEVQALNEGRIALPATHRSDLRNRFSGAKHPPVRDTDQTTPAGRFDHLRIQQPGQRHPTWWR